MKKAIIWIEYDYYSIEINDWVRKAVTSIIVNARNVFDITAFASSTKHIKHYLPVKNPKNIRVDFALNVKEFNI